jgi:hypothetical protein
LNGVLTEGGAVSNFEISPDSSRVVYHADQDTNGVSELYPPFREILSKNPIFKGFPGNICTS